MILGLLNKILHLGMGQWGEMWVLASEGVRGMPGVSPTKRRGQSKVLKTLLEFWVFLKKYPPCGGRGGGELGSQIIWGEIHLLGINVCKFL